MNHVSEFSQPPARRDDGRDLAACYARVFLGDDDGKRVLADLRTKFGIHRAVFQRGDNGRYDTIAAALVEGQRQVTGEIEAALKAGAPNQGLSEPK